MLLEQLKAGIIDSLVIQDPFRMGETAVNEAVKAMEGIKTPKEMLLPPRLVTAGNLNDPEIQTQLKPDLELYLGSNS
jgi:ABC-type sugar transport system substrate-binding protein